MLSFNGLYVFEQCSEVAACEDFPDGETKQILWASYHTFRSLTDYDDLLRIIRLSDTRVWWIRRELDGQRYNGRIRDRWCGTIRSYCEGSLTVPDKHVFTGLEGVGQRIAQLNGTIHFFD